MQRPRTVLLPPIAVCSTALRAPTLQIPAARVSLVIWATPLSTVTATRSASVRLSMRFVCANNSLFVCRRLEARCSGGADLGCRELHTVVQLSNGQLVLMGGSSNCYDCGASPLNDIWVSSTFGGEKQALRVYGPDCYVQPPGSQSAHWPVTGLGLLATATRLWL